MNIKKLTSKIIDYEQGDLDEFGVISLFSELITSGMIPKLQGSYERQAREFMSLGILDVHGNITEQTWKIINKRQ